MAKSKIVMLPGTGGEWNVNGSPWGEVRKTTSGTRKPSGSERKEIKRQIKTSAKGQSKRDRASGINQ